MSFNNAEKNPYGMKVQIYRKKTDSKEQEEQGDSSKEMIETQRIS